MNQKNDKYEISGLKAFFISKGIDYIEKQIKDDDINDMFDKIDDYFSDKRSEEVIEAVKRLLGKSYMIAVRRLNDLKKGEPSVVKEDKRAVAKAGRKAKGRRKRI